MENGQISEEETPAVRVVKAYVRKVFNWRDALEKARTQVSFEVAAPADTAADYFLGSALCQDIRMAEELSAVAAEVGATAKLIKLLSTRASKA
jgi:hypothetical protein